MTNRLLAPIILLTLCVSSAGAQTTAKPAPPAPAAAAKPSGSAKAYGPGVYAHFTTNRGNFIARLFQKEVPKTVENFVGLAEGTKAWKNTSGTMVKRPYYTGLRFHRVVPKFMIQGGDPEGTGQGGPGYTFPDEFHPKLRHSKPGILSMANRGPNTNGGQFFVTVAPTPWLDNKHSIFGEIVEGMDVVHAISKEPTRAGTAAPLKPVIIRTVRIERVS